MWKLQLAIWKLNMALGKLQMAIWKIQMAIGKLKNEHFEAKNGQNWQMVLDPKLSKMTAPNFGPNSLSGPSTVFQGSWSNQGGAPEDPPKKRQFVAQVTFWS